MSTDESATDASAPEPDLAARLDRVERVLGLQRLAAEEGREDISRAAGHSHQSNNCSHHSGASILCGAVAEEVMAERF